MDFSLPLLPTDNEYADNLYPSIPFREDSDTQSISPTIPLTPPANEDLYAVTPTEATEATEATVQPFFPPLTIPRREISYEAEPNTERLHRINHSADLLKTQSFRGNGSGGRYRNWCYTIILNDTDFHKAYNPTVELDEASQDIPLFRKLQNEVFFNIRTPIVYHVWEIEYGSHLGTKHIQGYVEFNDKIIMNTVKRVFCCSWMHLEPRQGTAKQASNYCKKNGAGSFTELGTMSTERSREAGSFGILGAEAERERWKNIHEDMMALPFDEWAAKYPDIAIKHPSSYKKVKFDSLALTPKPTLNGDLKDKNLWLWGPPGSGKSSYVYSRWPKAFRKPKNKWWDGYQFEDVVILDDVVTKDGDWMNGFLRQWADRYGFIAEIKGASAHIRPQRFIVTSNFSIDELFASCTDADREAIHRRFKEVHMGNRAELEVLFIN